MYKEDIIKWGKLTTNEIEQLKAFGFWDNLYWYQKLHLYILKIIHPNKRKLYYSGEIIEFKNGKVVKIVNDKPIRGKRTLNKPCDDYAVKGGEVK